MLRSSLQLPSRSERGHRSEVRTEPRCRFKLRYLLAQSSLSERRTHKSGQDDQQRPNGREYEPPSPDHLQVFRRIIVRKSFFREAIHPSLDYTSLQGTYG